MSALLNSTINKLRTEADAKRVELAELDASIEALVKIQGGAVSAIPRKGRKPKTSNGAEPSLNSEAAKDAALKAFM